MKKNLKHITWLLITTLLLQSCYTRKLTIDEYFQQKEQRNAEVYTVEGQKLLYTHLYMEDSTLYGVKWVQGEKVGLDLSQMNIKHVKNLSTGKTAGLIGGFIASLIVLIFLATFSIYGGTAI